MKPKKTEYQVTVGYKAVSEYKLIQSKQSNLSRNQREAVNNRIKFLLERGVITNQELYA